MATAAEIQPFALRGQGTIIAGEPTHDLFKLRSLTSVYANDCFDLLRDHQDALLRLSMHNKDIANEILETQIPKLPKKARALLKLAVASPMKRYTEQAGNYTETTIADLKAFLSHANVLQSKWWQKLFGATPPRRTLHRLAKTVGAKPPKRSGYAQQSDFAAEVQRILDWYTPGRKVCRYKRGIRRGPRDGPFKLDRKSAVTKKVKKHFQTLLHHRLPGLYRWRHAAQALIHIVTWLHTSHESGTT